MNLFQKTRFNPQTLQNEVLPYKTMDYVRWAVRNVGLILLIGTASIFIFDYAFDSPKDRAMAREIQFLEGQVEQFQSDVEEMVEVLEDIQLRDDAIYRTIFGTDPLPEYRRNPGVGGADRTEHLRGHDHTEEVSVLQLKIAEVQRRLVVQSRSFDEVMELAKTHEAQLQSIPAIQPI